VLQSRFDGGGTALAVSPDAHTIAVIDDRIRLWNVTDPPWPVRAGTLPIYTGHAAAMAFTPDGRALAMAYDGGVLVYDVTDPAQPGPLTPAPTRPGNDSNNDASHSRFSPGRYDPRRRWSS
jgi:hypothetical protein